MDGKLRYKPKTFMGVQDLKRPFSSPNYSNNGEVQICPTSSRSPNDLNLFPRKLREFSRTFMSISGSSSDVSNDILFRQEDKDFHQVKMWPPTQQLFIKSIVPNFGL